MILCVLIQNLSPHLEALGPIMDGYQKGDPAFADNSLKWLGEVEKTMSRLRLTEGSEMSILRSKIVKAVDISASIRDGSTKSVLRHAQKAAAAESLDRAEAIIRNRVLSSEERLRLFEEKLCEGITALMLKTSLPPRTEPYLDWLKKIWALLMQEPSTLPLTLYLTASLSSVDRTFILDRVMSRIMDNGLAPVPPNER